MYKPFEPVISKIFNLRQKILLLFITGLSPNNYSLLCRKSGCNMNTMMTARMPGNIFYLFCLSMPLALLDSCATFSKSK